MTPGELRHKARIIEEFKRKAPATWAALERREMGRVEELKRMMDACDAAILKFEKEISECKAYIRSLKKDKAIFKESLIDLQTEGKEAPHA